MIAATSDIPGSALADALTLAEAQRIVDEALRDKTYQLYPIGAEAATYLRIKRKRLTGESEQSYERILAYLALDHPTQVLEDFEPPAGTELVEEFLAERWGSQAAGTYNKSLAIVRDFFRFQIKRGRLVGDPTMFIESAKRRQMYRTTFTRDQRQAIIAEQELLRDRIALRLLLDYGLRKGSLRAVQFKHFDHVRKRLTIFAKGGKVRELPVPDPAFWHDLERHILDAEAAGGHYLMGQFYGNQAKRHYVPTKPMGKHGLHDWWYGCLQRAGIVPEGVTSGERMHKARHTAGQRVLDKTGNLKAAQKFLGHVSINTTGNLYTDWDVDQLAATLAQVFEEDED